MSLDNLRQNVVKQFYAATYLNDTTGQRVVHCYQAESPESAMMLAKDFASGKGITFVNVEPVDNQ